MTALLLLGPGTPMLFQGQEFAASQPFHYFAGFEGELAVDRGRKKELSQFPSLPAPALQAVTKDPAYPATFAACRLDWSERERNHEAVALRFFGSGGDDRLLLVNLGVDLELTVMPEPLLAPPEGTD